MAHFIRTFLAVFAVTASPAFAQNMLIQSPETVADLLGQYGEVTIGTASSGRPQLDGEVDGLLYGAVLYGCEDDRTQCDSIDYYAFFNDSPLEPAAFNAWNDEYRFGTAIDGGETTALIVMTHNFAGGITVENLLDTFEQYRESLNRFNNWIYSGGTNPPLPVDAPTDPGAPPKG